MVELFMQLHNLRQSNIRLAVSKTLFIPEIAKDCKLLLVWRDVVFFNYCRISDIFTGPAHYLLIMALGPPSFLLYIPIYIHCPWNQLKKTKTC